MPIDDAISQAANSLAHRSIYLDYLMTQVFSAPTYKMLPIVMCLVVIWFRRDTPRRAAILAVAGGGVALVIARVTQNLGPYRPRPLHNPDLGLVDAYGQSPVALFEWSSFPSDHAALVFALSAGIWVGSRGLGAFAFAWSTLIVCLPRLYLGLHYASDLLGGALIGLGSVWLVARLRIDVFLLARVAALYSHRPGVANVIAFVLLFQLATLFNDLRLGGRLAARATARIAGWGPEPKALRDESIKNARATAAAR
ncbi:phosphatase PAP2 family protein [Polymorphobacter fuscus]|uniref:Phosphatase PAP2 family protein n=1 Tax=Sandarakinorhabdus fusca TaxID=1439888 RepID=A0A7C9LF24_9SPHN|nr:phosphatase PAP2 family protein [Polymorphobacter fuscus]KAB7648807.1 phosphatase PAP2 family protein [Polymorphobacter fuscus]MQT16387.1 phosphatase PAP2 family protein [Polymorphobacter fuscus]NJC07324.1 undecaprenyl-diphosphatase [Polymorphobacter fuscus]